jgi:autotransporter-associated beta strand protein
MDGVVMRPAVRGESTLLPKTGLPPKTGHVTTADDRRVIGGWLAVLLALLVTGRGPAGHGASPELRGTWLTTTASDDLAQANVATTMATLRGVGLNTVYVEAWKNGYTNFTSPSLTAVTGTTSLNPSLAGRNLLAETRSAAAANGLVHGAWFEYGLAAGFGTPNNPLAIKARDNGWLLKDSAGNYTNTSNGYSWMNPLVPQVRTLIKGIAVEAVQQFDLQVIQFDDRLTWPVQFGYDDVTRATYLQETGRALPSSATDAQFVAWRQQKMQNFATELHAAIRAAKPDVVISLAPAVINVSTANLNAKWSDWVAAGLYDEVVPQAYRTTIAAFNTDWPAQVTAMGSRTDELAGGLRILGTGSATPWSDLRQMIDRTRQDASGHSLWYSEGVTRTGTAGYRTELTAYYDVANTGQAANPLFQSIRWAGTAGSGGSGTWGVVDATWTDRSTVWLPTARGIFDGAGGTVTVSGSIGVEGGLEFRGDGYVVTGGTLRLGGLTRSVNSIVVTGSATATVASRLVGTAGLTKSGSGRLVLGAGATSGLAGGLAVEQGTLVLTGSQGFAGGAAISGGRLLVNGDAATALGGVTVTGGTLGGTGILGGAVTVGAGGVVAPGDGIESLVVGGLTLLDGATVLAGIDGAAAPSVGADLLVVNGDLALVGTVSLLLADLAPGATVPRDTRFALVNYTGAWNGGLFTLGGTTLADGAWFTAGTRQWQIDYDALSGAANFAADQKAGRYVTITAVPEPGGIALAAAGIGLAAWRALARRGGRWPPWFRRTPAPPPGG